MMRVFCAHDNICRNNDVSTAIGVAVPGTAEYMLSYNYLYMRRWSLAASFSTYDGKTGIDIVALLSSKM